jgi:BlaI family transcriptional regulator, penicillinase repressor
MAPTPTDAELEILRVLWARGESTVREVHEAISAVKDVGYTTVLKQMQVMYRKGLLARTDRFRSHVYQPVQSQDKMQRQLAGAILQQAFGGSARQLLQSALAGRRVDPRELDEIRALLDEYKRKRR